MRKFGNGRSIRTKKHVAVLSAAVAACGVLAYFGYSLASGNGKPSNASVGASYIKVLDSTNAEPVGLSTYSNHCTLSRDGLGDTFHIQSGSNRCTWTNQHFSHMHRHIVFEGSERWDTRLNNPASWENNILIRPSGSFGNADCNDGGNHEVMLVTVRIKHVSGTDHWFMEFRGGTSLNLADQYQDPAYPGPIADGTSIDLGPVVQGQTVSFKFDLVTDYRHGAASAWWNGVQVYNNRDRPLGFHFDCNRSTDISNFDLRMQDGDYRGWTSGPMQLTSSGFGFVVDDPEVSPPPPPPPPPRSSSTAFPRRT